MPLKRILVVGAGLFGAIATKHLQSLGHEVTMVDGKFPDAGSLPAACLMKPSWFSSLGPNVYKPSLDLLAQHYDLKTIQFQLKPTNKKADVHWIDPKTIVPDIWGKDFLPLKVTGLEKEGNGWRVDFTSPQGPIGSLPYDIVIVAAGIYTNDVLNLAETPLAGLVPGLSGQYGCAFKVKGQIEQPFIKVWAPYRQLVAFNISPEEVWIGDGTALKRESFDQNRLMQCYHRCLDSVQMNHGGKPDVTVITGARPYVKGAKPAYLNEAAPGLWAVTGGAKNGTLAAGWCAYCLGIEFGHG